MAGFATWWCKGETGSVRVFRQGAGIPVLCLGAVIFVNLAMWERCPHAVSIFIMCFSAVDSGLSLRRAIILTNDEVIYRPPFGEMLRVRLSEVTDVGKGIAPWGTSFILKPSPGIRLRTLRGDVSFPLFGWPGDNVLAQVQSRVRDAREAHRV